MLFQNPVFYYFGKSFFVKRKDFIYFSSTVHNPIKQIKLFQKSKSRSKVNKPVPK